MSFQALSFAKNCPWARNKQLQTFLCHTSQVQIAVDPTCVMRWMSLFNLSFSLAFAEVVLLLIKKNKAVEKQ